MSEKFDPYYKWLGILPEEQPPNHYRLLGIPLFMPDHDVIANAADQRMAYLRAFQTGQQSGVSQKLLNEVASARVCLLDADKKAAYDIELRARIEGQTPAGVSVEKTTAGSYSPIPIGEDEQIPVGIWVNSDSDSVSSSDSNQQAATAAPDSPNVEAVESDWQFPAPVAQAQNIRKVSLDHKRRRTKLNLLGHIVAPLLGLALGGVALYFLRGFPLLSRSTGNGAVSASNNVKAAAPPLAAPAQSAGSTQSIAPAAGTTKSISNQQHNSPSLSSDEKSPLPRKAVADGKKPSTAPKEQIVAAKDKESVLTPRVEVKPIETPDVRPRAKKNLTNLLKSNQVLVGKSFTRDGKVGWPVRLEIKDYHVGRITGEWTWKKHTDKPDGVLAVEGVVSGNSISLQAINPKNKIVIKGQFDGRKLSVNYRGPHMDSNVEFTVP